MGPLGLAVVFRDCLKPPPRRRVLIWTAMACPLCMSFLQRMFAMALNTLEGMLPRIAVRCRQTFCRHAIHWALAILVTVCVVGMAGGRLFAQRPARVSPPAGLPAASGGTLWISATPLDDTHQLLIVIDPQLRNAAIYHVDGPGGTLTLKSTRDITWDLMVGDFNSQEPKPSALKKMLEMAP